MSGAAEETKITGAERPEGALPAVLIGFADSLRLALTAERDRWFLWLPVFLGAGISISR